MVAMATAMIPCIAITTRRSRAPLPLENTFLTLEVATGDTDFRTFGEIQFFGLEIEKMVIIGTGNGYETLHIMVGNDYFLAATGISNIL